MSSMRRRDFLRGAGALAIGAAVHGCQRPRVGPPDIAVPDIRTDADIDRLIPRISNWGRWGAADRRGTLNLIGEAERRAASRLVRSGLVVSLARETDLRQGVERGALEVTRRPRGSRDFIGMVYHGFSMTHLDGLAHVFNEDGSRLYNGLDARTVRPDGASELGAELMGAEGIVGRGVLLDIASQRGAPLEPGTAIRIADLDGAMRAQDVEVVPGDLVFVRTGAGTRNTRERRSGLHPECLAWLRGKDVALLGSDGDSDVAPLPGFDRWASAMHSVAIPYLGLPLLDNAELDRLSETCRAHRRWEFQAVLAPLRLRGATGSPINPLAVL